MSVYGGVRITQNTVIFSGRPIINGHRITVHDIVARYELGEFIEEIAGGYSLTHDEVASTLAYDADLKAVIDRETASDEREAELSAILLESLGGSLGIFDEASVDT